MHHPGKHSIGRFLMIGIGWTMLVIIVATIAVYFSWNMAMPDLFGAVPMSFSNAFGLVLLAAMASWIPGSWGSRAQRQPSPKNVERENVEREREDVQGEEGSRGTRRLACWPAEGPLTADY